MRSRLFQVPSASPLNLKDQKIQKIGIFKFRNIGDVLLMTPAIRAIREAFPDSNITAIVNSGTEAMLQNNPHLNQVISYQRGSYSGWKKLKHEFNFFREIRNQKFDLLFNLASGARPAWSALFSGARWRVSHYQWWSSWNWKQIAYTHCYHIPSEPPHQALYAFHLLNQCGIPTPPETTPSHSNRLELRLSSESVQWADQFLYRSGITSFIHIHPVSRWLFKCWDDLRFAQLIDWIQETHKTPVILTSGPEPREQEKARSILNLCRLKPLSFIGQISLPQTAALIHRSQIFIGVDTAPMHIAAALNKPVIALFGPSGESDWSPWTSDKIVLNKGCPCGPNLKDGCQHDQLRRCMAAIHLEDVKTAFETMLNSRS